MIVHHVLDVYGTHLHLASTQKDWKTLCQAYPKISPKDVVGNKGYTAIFGGEDDHVHICFFVRQSLSTTYKVEVAAHEACHGALFLLEDIKVKVDAQSEPLAYLVGWLTRWLWENVC